MVVHLNRLYKPIAFKGKFNGTGIKNSREKIFFVKLGDIASYFYLVVM